MRTRLGWFCIAGTIATALVTAGGCRQIAGISESPPQALTSTVCGLPYGTSTCAACANRSCCAESTACAADDPCSAYEGCLGQCNGDPECRSQCGIDHPGGVSDDVIALSTCLASHCESECGLTCGAMADLISPPSAAKACEHCLTTNACAQAEACASSTVCNGDMRADSAFATIDSAEVYETDQCATDAGTGLSLNLAGFVDVCGSRGGIDTDAATSQAAASFRYTCASACATGSDWSCVGHVTWPPPKSPACTIGYRVSDYVTPSAPVGEALVQVCSPSDVNCAEPLAHGMVGPDGTLSLTVPNEAMAGAGFQGLNGFTRISGPNLQTQDSYWGFPLVEGRFPVARISVISPAEIQQLFAEVQVTPIAGRGVLDVEVLDCRNQLTSGVNVDIRSADALTKGFSTHATAATATDETGLIFFVNVPAGPTTVTATTSEPKTPAAQVVVNVQPDITTVVSIFKTPSP